MWCFKQILEEELFFCGGGSLTCWGIFGLSTGRISSHRIMLSHHRIPSHGTVRIPQTLPHEAERTEIWKLLHTVSEPRSVRVSWNVWDVGTLISPYLLICLNIANVAPVHSRLCSEYLRLDSKYCASVRKGEAKKPKLHFDISSLLIHVDSIHCLPLSLGRFYHGIHCWGGPCYMGYFWFHSATKHFSLPCAQGHRWSWCHYVVGCQV